MSSVQADVRTLKLIFNVAEVQAPTTALDIVGKLMGEVGR